MLLHIHVVSDIIKLYTLVIVSRESKRYLIISRKMYVKIKFYERRFSLQSFCVIYSTYELTIVITLMIVFFFRLFNG